MDESSPADAPAPATTRSQPPATPRRLYAASPADFTTLFNAFRLAMAPANLCMALLAILLLLGAGKLFDLVWGRQTAPQEITQYQLETPHQFHHAMRQWREQRPATLQAMLRHARAAGTHDQRKAWSQDPQTAFSHLYAANQKRFFHAIAAARKRYQQELHDKSITQRQERNRLLHARKTAAQQLMRRIVAAKVAVGRPIFSTFTGYERRQFADLVADTLGVVRVASVNPNLRTPRMNVAHAVTLGLFTQHPHRLQKTNTVAGNLWNIFYTGPAWLMTAAPPLRRYAGEGAGHLLLVRCLYIGCILLLLALFLVLASLVGAAVSRGAAMSFAGQEAQPGSALRFAAAKYPTLISVWLLPFVMILFGGVVLMLASLLGAIPAVGEVLVGVLLVLFLAGGFILMLTVLGTLGGFHLLFPALAVENGDTFDALSRAYSFLFARPWRTLLYTAAALAYGIVTYLFLSFALYVLLLCTHHFTAWGMDIFGAVHSAYTGQGKLEALWPRPVFSRFLPPIDYAGLSFAERAGAACMRFWVGLVTLILPAYVVAYYFSSSTIIYLLLRRSVDGQELGDLASASAEAAPAPPAAAAPAVAAAAVAPPAAPPSAPSMPEDIQ